MYKMKNQLLRLTLIVFLGVCLVLSSLTAYAAEAWTLPNSGLHFEKDAKQAYVAERMGKIFNSTAAMYSPFTPPDGWKYESYGLNSCKAETLENPNSATERVVLQFHGGGYINTLGNGHRDLCVKQMVLTGAKKAYMLDYRVAPKYSYPAALDDAVSIYEDILAKGVNPRDIVIFGDSAGGNLALALSLYLRDTGKPQPGALILISPWTTFETNLPSRLQNVDKDLILGKINHRMYNEVKNPSYGKGLADNDPRLSPIYANLDGLPPMLIQAGGYELFLDESILLAKKAAADGVSVTLTVYPGMSHDFALLLPELEDSVNSFREIRDFVNIHMK